MAWIVDASFTSALFLPEKHSRKVEDFFNNISEGDDLIVPAIWWYEISNVMIVAERKRRLSACRISDIFTLLDHLEMATDIQQGAEYMRRVYDLAKEYGLSSYDASYLESAVRNEASLATLDDEMRRAAKQMSISLFKL